MAKWYDPRTWVPKKEEKPSTSSVSETGKLIVTEREASTIKDTSNVKVVSNTPSVSSSSSLNSSKPSTRGPVSVGGSSSPSSQVQGPIQQGTDEQTFRATGQTVPSTSATQVESTPKTSSSISGVIKYDKTYVPHIGGWEAIKQSGTNLLYGTLGAMGFSHFGDKDIIEVKRDWAEPFEFTGGIRGESLEKQKIPVGFEDIKLKDILLFGPRTKYKTKGELNTEIKEARESKLEKIEMEFRSRVTSETTTEELADINKEYKKAQEDTWEKYKPLISEEDYKIRTGKETRNIIETVGELAVETAAFAINPILGGALTSIGSSIEAEKHAKTFQEYQALQEKAFIGGVAGVFGGVTTTLPKMGRELTMLEIEDAYKFIGKKPFKVDLLTEAKDGSGITKIYGTRGSGQLTQTLTGEAEYFIGKEGVSLIPKGEFEVVTKGTLLENYFMGTGKKTLYTSVAKGDFEQISKVIEIPAKFGKDLFASISIGQTNIQTVDTALTRVPFDGESIKILGTRGMGTSDLFSGASLSKKTFEITTDVKNIQEFNLLGGSKGTDSFTGSIGKHTTIRDLLKAEDIGKMFKGGGAGTPFKFGGGDKLLDLTPKTIQTPQTQDIIKNIGKQLPTPKLDSIYAGKGTYELTSFGVPSAFQIGGITQESLSFPTQKIDILTKQDSLMDIGHINKQIMDIDNKQISIMDIGHINKQGRGSKIVQISEITPIQELSTPPILSPPVIPTPFGKGFGSGSFKGFYLPAIPFPSLKLFDYGTKKTSKGKTMKGMYAPSLVGIGLGIKAPKIPTLYKAGAGGLIIRPMISTKSGRKTNGKRKRSSTGTRKSNSRRKRN